VAEDLAPKDGATEAKQAPRAPTTPSSHVFRFGLAYILLAMIVGVAVGLAIVLYSRPGAGEGVAWSRWEPTAEGGTRIQEIANHVARRYRLPNRDPLVAVYARSPTTERGDIRAIAVSSPVVRTSQDVSLFNTETNLIFNLCGEGDNCEVVGSPASEARGALLRREALELALYAFKYVEDVKSIVTFMPPRQGTQTRYALFFDRDQVAEFLDRPLARTLVQPSILVVGQRPADLPLVDELTLRRYYRSELRQTPDGSMLLLLDPAVLGAF
jgi:hypothetical protein